MVRSGGSADLGVSRVDRTGHESAGRTETGLFPSDHAGVLAELGVRATPD